MEFVDEYTRVQENISYTMKVKLKMIGSKRFVFASHDDGYVNGWAYKIGDNAGLRIHGSDSQAHDCFYLLLYGSTNTEKQEKSMVGAFSTILLVCGLNTTEFNKINNDTNNLSNFFTRNNYNYKIWCSNKNRYINLKSEKYLNTDNDERYRVEMYATND